MIACMLGHLYLQEFFCLLFILLEVRLDAFLVVVDQELIIAVRARLEAIDLDLIRPMTYPNQIPAKVDEKVLVFVDRKSLDKSRCVRRSVT